MAIKRPDIYEHNNADDAIVDSDFLRGSFRTAVADLTALYALSPKVDQLKQRSTVVYVTGLGTYYELIDIVNVGNSSGWQPFLSTSAVITGAGNGLSLNGKNVVLGGKPLTGATTINLNDNTFVLKSQTGTTYGLANFSVNNTYANSKFGICSVCTATGAAWGLSGTSTSISMNHTQNATNGSCILINNGDIIISNLTSNVSKTVCLATNALIYGACYHSSYVNRTLVDKEYVDNCIAGVSNILNVNNVGTTYTTVATDDFVGVSGTSLIYLMAAPTNGQRIIIADICGNALFAPITVDGNGKKINDGTVSCINTNYGSITYIYNCHCWSAVAFVN